MNFIVQILNIYIENLEPHKHVAQIRKKFGSSCISYRTISKVLYAVL